MIKVPEEQVSEDFIEETQLETSRENSIIKILIIVILLLFIPYFWSPSPEQTSDNLSPDNPSPDNPSPDNPSPEQFQSPGKGRAKNRNMNQYKSHKNISYKNSTQILKGELGVDVKDYSDIISADIKELPICILVLAESPQKLEEVSNSAENQSYSNFRVVEVASNATNFEQTDLNYFQLKQLIRRKCVLNSILLFASDTISSNTLQQLNQIYQTQSVWASFSESQEEFCIHSVYQRVFELISLNDFEQTNADELGYADPGIIALALIELSARHAVKLKGNSMITKSFISLEFNKTYGYNRKPYESLISLTHSFHLDKKRLINSRDSIQMSQKYNRLIKGILPSDMLRGMENREMLYLSHNHSMYGREERRMSAKYEFSKQKKELPLCVFVASHNNIESNRYQRVILSILQQQYSNYHIVFTDDFSNDSTLLETMRLVKKQGFPDNRIVYIRNLQQNFATYNILNAAVNYCEDEDIQVLVDGDDELLGPQTFRLINYMYHKRDNWVVYTAFMNNWYMYGSSQLFNKISQSVSSTGKRIRHHYIGHLTTWYVAFLKKIQLKDHKRQNGTWLDTLYDEAIQHPLLEMAHEQHIEYVPEVTYIYNFGYGDNDDSTAERAQKREKLLSQILRRPVYSKIEGLNFSQQNWEVLEELSADYGIKYKEITQDQLLFSNLIHLSLKKTRIKKSVNYQTAALNNKDKTPQLPSSGSLSHFHPFWQDFTKTEQPVSFSQYIKANQPPQYTAQNEKQINQTLLAMSALNYSAEGNLEKDMFRAFSLTLKPYDQPYLSTEYYLLNNEFNIWEPVEQIPFCIIAISRNSKQYFNKQIDSILRQNYTNYRIHIVDDASDDGSDLLINTYIQQLSKYYRSKITYTQNNERKYSLFNINHAIREHCSEGDLILDLDTDGLMIGNQVLNLLNHQFRSNHSLWLLYSLPLSIINRQGLQHQSMEFYPEDVVASNSFRQSGEFKASQLKVFYFELYQKVDENDFLDQFGNYYIWNSDLFIQYPLMEMVCPEHCKKLYRFLYLENSAQELTQSPLRQKHEQSIVQNLIPYTKLNSFNDPPQRMIRNQNQLQRHTLQKFLSQINQIKLSSNKKTKEESACVIATFESIPQIAAFVDNLVELEYTHRRNYRFINFAPLGINSQTATKFSHRNFRHFQVENINQQSSLLQTLFQVIHSQCQGFKYIVFASSLFKKNGIESLLGALVSHENAWILHDTSDGKVSANIYAVRKSVFEQIQEKNIFTQKHKQKMSQNMDYLPLALLQICNGHILQINQLQFFEEQFQSIIGINANKNSENKIDQKLSFEKFESL